MSFRLGESRAMAALLLSMAIGFLIALHAYFAPLTGVTGSGGALMATAVPVLIFLLSGILAKATVPALRIFLSVIILILLAGNCFASVLLHQWWLSAMMVIGFMALVIDMLGAARISETNIHEVP